MNNIFDGLAKLSDDEIRGQIAILKCVTFSNTLKEQGHKAVKFLVEAAGGIFGKNSESANEEEMIQLVNIKRLVDENYNMLAKCDREELDKRLKEELIMKCRALGLSNIQLDAVDGAVSVCVIREASKVYSIDIYKTPGQQADEIHEKYYEHYLKVLKKKLERLTAEEKSRLEAGFQRSITKTDINQMRQLAYELMLREFNGKTILTKILVTQGTNTLKKVIDYMGLGAFNAIECVINTAYDSMLSFCRIERAVLAQVVWTAINGYGRKMTLKDDLMPSYRADFEAESGEKERKLLILIGREKQLNGVIKDLLKEIDKNNRLLASKETVHEADKERLLSTQGEYRDSLVARERMAEDGERVKAAYEEYIKRNPTAGSSDAEFRYVKQEYENAARVIRSQDYKITTYEKNIMKLSESIEKQRIQIEEIKRILKEYRENLIDNVNEFNQVIVELENEAGYYSQILCRKWTKFYVDWDFEEVVFEKVVKQFSGKEWVAIEKLLTEMEQSEAREYFAFKTLQEQKGNVDAQGVYENLISSAEKTMVTYCIVSVGKYAQITYKGNKVIDICVKDRK